MLLPSYSGRFPVGLTTFVKPIRPTFTIGTGRDANGVLALKMEEVAFNVFYPAELNGNGHKPSKNVDWLMKPFSEMINGYSKFTGIGGSRWLIQPLVCLVGTVLKIPVYPNPPLLAPPANLQHSAEEKPKWPVVFFFHGLCGSRTTYSQFCGQLASQGYVVVAMEHREGSGPMVFPRSETTGKPTPRAYIKNDELNFERDFNAHMPLRIDQLKFRRREIYEALESVKGLAAGDKGTLETIDGSQHAWDHWKDNIQVEKDIILTGHSFGGATTLSLLSNDPPEGFPAIPVSKVVLLDPWMEPLASPGPAPQYPLKPPALIINSEHFTLWNEHFSQVESLVKGWQDGGSPVSLLTIVRGEHMDFSDFSLLIPFGGRTRGNKVLTAVNRASLAFIREDLPSALKTLTTVPFDPQPAVVKGRHKKVLRGEMGDVVIHTE